METILLALLLSTLAGLSTTIGSLIAFVVKKPSNKFISFIMGFSAGVMILVSFVELLQEGIQTNGMFAGIMFFLIGMGIMLLIDMGVTHYYEFEDGDGLVKIMESGKPYRGELNIIVPEDMYYVVVEERLPAGLEAINFNLETTDTSLRHQLEEFNKAGKNYWIDNPLWHFNHREMRDDRVLLFADYLPKGVYVFEYSTRVVHKGRYQTGMAQIQCMYAPEFNSHSESFTLAVD